MPWDRAVLATFAELVSRDELGPVADIGCGPGRITGYLHYLGLDAFGVDLSPGMLAVARQALPRLRFVEGSMTGLDLPDGSLGGWRDGSATLRTTTPKPSAAAPSASWESAKPPSWSPSSPPPPTCGSSEPGPGAPLATTT